MSDIIPVIKCEETFTPFWFYTKFLNDLATVYFTGSELKGFLLFEHGDERIYESKYRIDPIAIPLLLNVFGQLKKYYNEPITLFLNNNAATKDTLAFLDRANFFKISGKNRNPTYPLGRNIAKFDETFLGAYESENPRCEHQVRAYSIKDDQLEEKLSEFLDLEAQRDYLSSQFTYKVKNHFAVLLELNDNTSELRNLFIDILSELITNGVLHSKSDTYALMFVDKYSTKFSISDNGIGLIESISLKEKTLFYKPMELTQLLKIDYGKLNIDKRLGSNLYVIFETLFFSSLKNRQGLFDLMINAVLICKGYFRLHTDHCQIVVSNRMMTHLIELNKTREKIFEKYNDYSIGNISSEELKISILKEAESMKEQFISFFNFCTEKYSLDVKYSSIRFFNVKFRGVHVEVEIPFENL